MSHMRYPRLRCFNSSGAQVSSDVLVMCFYMQHAHKHISPAVMRTLDILRERLPPQSLDWYIDPEGQSHPLDDTVWEGIRKEMLGPDEVCYPRLAGGSRGTDAFYVDYRGLPLPLPWPGREHDVSGLYLHLPTEYLEEQGPSQVSALALELAQGLPFNSGYVDLGLIGASTRPDEGLGLVRTRYPGIHMTWTGPEISVGTQVHGVHWMNFLGQPVLGKLGGVAGLRERLALPGISIQEMSGDRAVITLGEQPDAGDLEAGRTLPLHRALARLLEPHLYSSKRPPGRMTPDEWRRWERRFLD